MSTLRVAVVGVGIAGRVRIRDLISEIPLSDSQLPGVTFAGYVSRRNLSIDGTEQISLENVLDDKNINAIFVCTENERHETIARQALEAGKHVLVEYPLALTADAAKDLYKIADRKDVLCYEEDISLLTDNHRKIKELVGEKRVKEIEMSTKGRPNGWLEDIDRSGSPFVSGISMLHRVLDLTGEAHPKEAFIIRNAADSFSAVAKLEAKGSVNVTLTYERAPDLERRATNFSITLGDGTIINETNLPSMIPKQNTSTRSGLFLKDTMQFVRTVRKERSAIQSQELTVRALELADELYLLAKSSARSTGL